MNSRLTILPDARFEAFHPALQERLQQAANLIQPDNFASVLDPIMRDLIERGFREVQADEGTIWLLNEAKTHLVPAYNTGPNAAQIVGKFEQPLSMGLICMVLASEQPFIENEVYRNAQQSKMLDQLLGVQTQALMVVPFYYQRCCRGVLSGVRLVPPSDPKEVVRFDAEHLGALQRTSMLLTRLLELHLLTETLGGGQVLV